MNIDIKEQIDNDNNINQVEITAHDINSDDKTKI
jgi:hypothetical protein